MELISSTTEDGFLWARPRNIEAAESISEKEEEQRATAVEERRGCICQVTRFSVCPL